MGLLKLMLIRFRLYIRKCILCYGVQVCGNSLNLISTPRHKKQSSDHYIGTAFNFIQQLFYAVFLKIFLFKSILQDVSAILKQADFTGIAYNKPKQWNLWVSGSDRINSRPGVLRSSSCLFLLGPR